MLEIAYQTNSRNSVFFSKRRFYDSRVETRGWKAFHLACSAFVFVGNCLWWPLRDALTFARENWCARVKHIEICFQGSFGLKTASRRRRYGPNSKILSIWNQRFRASIGDEQNWNSSSRCISAFSRDSIAFFSQRASPATYAWVKVDGVQNYESWLADL